MWQGLNHSEIHEIHVPREEKGRRRLKCQD